MNDAVITFIGGGNMAASLIGGLIADGWEPNRIRVSEPNADRSRELAERYRIRTYADNNQACADADVVVLAVKPQTVKAVAQEVANTVNRAGALVISIAAGVREPDIRRWLGGDAAVVRSMPNTPALVQTGATGLFANDRVQDRQRDLAETVLRAVGLTLWVAREELLDAVTALSGSGPAYFFLLMEALEQAGHQLGIGLEEARLLTLQTALGAAKMALESSDSPATLRQKVTSPGGTTEQALAVLEQGGLRPLVQQALDAARARAVQLGDALGGA